MYVLGITGGIGSGKTAATDRFAYHGITIVDSDVIAHQIVDIGSPALQEIAFHFGQSILSHDGSLKRAKLRELIFSNKQEKEWLEDYLHPLIRAKTIETLNQANSPYAILSAPLLLEKNLEFMVDKVLVIDSPESLQIDRSCRRDKSSIETIQKIMQQQLSRRERRARADDIINNDGTLEELHQNVDKYHRNLISELSSLKQVKTINKI